MLSNDYMNNRKMIYYRKYHHVLILDFVINEKTGITEQFLFYNN